MTTLAIKTCPRCGGFPYEDDEDIRCLQCAHVIAPLQKPAYKPRPPVVTGEFARATPTRDALYLALTKEQRWMTSAEIGVRVGKGTHHVAHVMVQLCSRGYVERRTNERGRQEWRVRA